MLWLHTTVESAVSLQAPASEVTQAEAPAVWDISGNVFYSEPPGGDMRVTPIIYADRGPLHIEARYGYEDEDTVSLFAGWTFETGEELSAAFTPMLGAVVGDTDGIAPGLEFDLGWRRVSWYAEMEYVFDVHDHDEDYYYSWSTLMYGLSDAFSAGLVAERSKLVDTEFSVQHGLALEYKHSNVALSLYAYDLESDDSYAVVAFQFAP